MRNLFRRAALAFVVFGSLFTGVAVADPWADAVDDFLDHLDLFFLQIDDDLDGLDPDDPVARHLTKARERLEDVEGHFDAQGRVRGLRKAVKPFGKFVVSLGKAVSADDQGPVVKSARVAGGGLFGGCDNTIPKLSVCASASQILVQFTDDAEALFETFDAAVREGQGDALPKKVGKKLDRARELFESGRDLLDGTLADGAGAVVPAKSHPVKKGLSKMLKALGIAAAALDKFPPPTQQL